MYVNSLWYLHKKRNKIELRNLDIYLFKGDLIPLMNLYQPLLVVLLFSFLSVLYDSV